MPNYDYACQRCQHSFVALLSIADRETPITQPCPNCLKRGVERVFKTAPMGGVDKTLSPGSNFKEMMNKVARGVPERYRETLYKAADLRGGKLGSQ